MSCTSLADPLWALSLAICFVMAAIGTFFVLEITRDKKGDTSALEEEATNSDWNERPTCTATPHLHYADLSGLRAEAESLTISGVDIQTDGWAEVTLRWKPSKR